MNDEVVHFDVNKSMKQPNDMNVFSIADVYYEDEKELSLEKQLTVEPLAAVLLNFEHEDVKEYEETICVLTGMGSYSYAHKKLDLDLKNQPSPPAKPLDILMKSEQCYRQCLYHCLCSLPHIGNGQGIAYANLGNGQGIAYANVGNAIGAAYAIAYAHCLT
ncbi:hypothetical protein CQW23_23890 [Capsicum baccatum]|uniref:Uncharacterized protein n=1 Tax=Capsicum baccatum TaxID=33114 RepID=A0A2G2VT72_CAPBA|nr:hypothetical protein CQW23_23890 [Capsicum baccatum]